MMAEKRWVVIELMQQQVAALANQGESPPRVLNPETKENFVLISVEEYKRLTDDGYDYDDSDWTREELDALHWEMHKHEPYDEYDDMPDNPHDNKV